MEYDPSVPLEQRRYRRYANLAQTLEAVGCEKDVLDVGTGPGTGLKAFRDKGWKVVGLEPDASRSRIARELHHLEIVEKTVEQFAGERTFSVVTLVHVLEHFHDPLGALRGLARCLKPGGYIYVEVPDIKAFVDWLDAVYFEHMNMFSSETLCRMASRAGLRPCVRFFPKTRPFGITHIGYLFQRDALLAELPLPESVSCAVTAAKAAYRTGHPNPPPVDNVVRFRVPFINDICFAYDAQPRVFVCDAILNACVPRRPEKPPSRTPHEVLVSAYYNARHFVGKLLDNKTPNQSPAVEPVDLDFETLRYEVLTSQPGSVSDQSSRT